MDEIQYKLSKKDQSTNSELTKMSEDFQKRIDTLQAQFTVDGIISPIVQTDHASNPDSKFANLAEFVTYAHGYIHGKLTEEPQPKEPCEEASANRILIAELSVNLEEQTTQLSTQASKSLTETNTSLKEQDMYLKQLQESVSKLVSDLDEVSAS
jgi:uncharacterized FlaG/YvyC family protein